MVQPSFSGPRKAKADQVASPTAPLDAFLDNQHQSYYEELYKSEAVCLCVLRLLPPVCRQIVLHQLWSYSALKATELRALCQLEQAVHVATVEEIIRPALTRNIFHANHRRNNKTEWSFNDAYKKGLRNALTGKGTSNSFGVPIEGLEGRRPTGEELFQFGETIWEVSEESRAAVDDQSILRYMVSSGLEGGGPKARKPNTEVLQLLEASGLMADPYQLPGRAPSLQHMTITSQGFQFLLEDRQTQLWQILMFYLNVKEATDERSAVVLSVFFSLGCMQLGQGYSASQSFPHAYTALDDLEQYGFIYKRSQAATGTKEDLFYPTHLATSLLSGDVTSATAEAAEDKRFLILETNYKIYAYTANELEIAILNLFVDIRIRYKNLVVGKLDRKHVKRAMDKGINAYQIISYLASHAHPQMYTSPPPLLHTTITDQLHLWDKERNRLKTEDALMFDFFSKELFEDTETEAKRYAGLLVSVPEKKLLFVDPRIRDAIKDFIKSQQLSKNQ